MLDNLSLEHLLFLDIETVPQYKSFDEVPSVEQELFLLKTQYQRKENMPVEEFYDRAGIWAEFGKIVCISVGYFVLNKGKRQFRVTSFSGDEKLLLIAFKDLLESHFSKPQNRLCAHNGKEFDFPYISRRMLIQGINLPRKLQLFGKKPWEIPHLDTLDLWKFGDFKHYTSLKLLTQVLQIPSPKDDIDGSQVRTVFYEERDLNRIVKYCEKDTIAVAQILLRLRQESLLLDDEIAHI